MQSSILDELNPQQQRAVTTVDGPILILAGAGSGKTKTLTHRIAYLLNEHSVSPTQILAVTFTNKAAAEMRERTAQLLGQSADNRSFLPFLGTFHSICVRLLRRDGQEIGIDPNFIIFDSADQKAAVKRAMQTLKLDPQQTEPRNAAQKG
jgi:DNA helicase-2/ATP-dependent DNA helicase PcrA